MFTIVFLKLNSYFKKIRKMAAYFLKITFYSLFKMPVLIKRFNFKMFIFDYIKIVYFKMCLYKCING